MKIDPKQIARMITEDPDRPAPRSSRWHPAGSRIIIFFTSFYPASGFDSDGTQSFEATFDLNGSDKQICNTIVSAVMKGTGLEIDEIGLHGEYGKGSVYPGENGWRLYEDPIVERTDKEIIVRWNPNGGVRPPMPQVDILPRPPTEPEEASGDHFDDFEDEYTSGELWKYTRRAPTPDIHAMCAIAHANAAAHWQRHA
tara:strand:+ start:1150 stop:1743 length:594 start_codon:yes stop_codon:yes gene_type:complete